MSMDFERWRQKPEITVDGYPICHNNQVFNKDGVVDRDSWFAAKKDGKGILFLLKEAYHNDDKEWMDNGGFFCLTEYLHNLHRNGMWLRAAEWVYAIFHTTAHAIASYDPDKISREQNEYLRKTAVVNLKKSGGKSNSKMEEICAYAKADADELREQIMEIDPNIIICGYTFGPLNELMGNMMDKKKYYNSNWFYTFTLNNHPVLVIDYYHPANHYPALMQYYGIAAIYQQALLGENEQHLFSIDTLKN